LLSADESLRKAVVALDQYFTWQDQEGKSYRPDQVWVDSGYVDHQIPAYAACDELNRGCAFGSERWRPAKGHGEKQRFVGRYRAPKNRTNEILYVGPGYHLTWQRDYGLLLVHVNSDTWKTELTSRFTIGSDSPRALTLFEPSSLGEHREFSKHLIAEEPVLVGSVYVWRRVNRQNHYLDASYLAVAAGDFVSRMRAEAEAAKAEAESASSRGVVSQPSVDVDLVAMRKASGW
jgi:hypothetical protein